MKSEAKRGRPRQFDEDETLDRIMQVFWKHGYSATSLDQIAASTGLNRPSLYAAFGSKKNMYLLVLKRFADQMEQLLRQEGAKAEGANPRMKALMSAAIAIYTGQTPLSSAAYGCLALSTLPAEAALDPDFKRLLSEMLGRMDNGFSRLVRHETEKLGKKVAADEIGEQLALVLDGLSLRARAGEDPEKLRTLAFRAVDRLLPEDL